MHALIILQILSVLGTLSATVPLERGNRPESSQDRHSKALEGPSAVAFHFKSITQHQTIPPTQATKVTALSKTIVGRTPSVKKSTPARARLPSTTVKKSLVRKTLRASPKAYEKKVCRRADNAQTGVSCSTAVETLTGGTATPPPGPSCDEIETCVECIQHKCNYAVADDEKPRCVSTEEDWGWIKAKGSLHCKFFEEVSQLRPDIKSLITKPMQKHIFSSKPTAKEMCGSHMDTTFQYYMSTESLTYDERFETANGIFRYTNVRQEGRPRRKHVSRSIYTTWDSNGRYKRRGVLTMCQIAVRHSRNGRVVVPNSFDGAPVCIRIVSGDDSPKGSCYPLAEAIMPNAEPGTAC